MSTASGGLCNSLFSQKSLLIWVTVCLALLLYVSTSFYGGSPLEIAHGSLLSYSSDRAEMYKVKILPTSLDDEALFKLPPHAFSYVVIVDAGSSGCRAHVYKYGKLGIYNGPLYILPQHTSKKVKPGLSSFANNPQDAGASLIDMITFVKEQIPEDDWKTTPIWLKATAGLRMLDASVSEQILNSVRSVLKDQSPFIFKGANVISGNEEGGFGWIAFNYLKKIIGPRKTSPIITDPYAVVEMGGASAQVSQMAVTNEEKSAIPNDMKFQFSIEGEEFTLFTHSYLGYGAEQGREQLNKNLLEMSTDKSNIQDVCLNVGYSRSTVAASPYEGPKGDSLKVSGSSTGSGNCLQSLSKLFAKESQPASSDTDCQATKAKPQFFGCVDVPVFVRNSRNMLVFENFYYTTSAIGVKTVDMKATTFPLITTPQNIKSAAAEVCSKTWTEVASEYPKDGQDKENNSKWCFTASYAASFLTDGLKLQETKSITVQKEVGDSEIEWALGAAYKEAAEFLKKYNLRQP